MRVFLLSPGSWFRFQDGNTFKMMNPNKAPESPDRFCSTPQRAARASLATILALLACIASPTHAQISFTKITTGPIASDRPESSISPVWVDFDADGDLDLFVTANQPAGNLLYRNDGLGNFTKITESAIVSTGAGSRSVAWGDLDNDGRVDLVIGRSVGPALLFLQRTDGTFAQSSLDTSLSFGLGLADYDHDGAIDLVIANNGTKTAWHNDGRGGLISVSGTDIDASGTSPSWADYDGDGDLDLLVTESAATGGGPSRLYRNEGGGRFTQVASGPLVEQSTEAPGSSWGDYDNDGFLDVFVTRRDVVFRNPLPSFLFHNNGDGTFAQVEQSPFIDDVGSGFSASWADYDNDGWLDLFVTDFDGGGNRLYHNNADGTFTRVLSGPVATEAAQSANATWGDYDRNGFLDLFVCNQGGNSLYHNDGNSNSWLSVKCVGTRSNRSAIGANVRVQAVIGGKTFWQLRGVGGAHNPFEAHFGLGDATNVLTVRIEWPSGTVQEFHNTAVRQFLTVTEPSRLVASPPNSAMEFTLEGGRNMIYDIQVSTNLTAWALLRTVTIASADGAIPILDTNAPSSDPRFYRALLHQ